jgi:hypothetical protein
VLQGQGESLIRKALTELQLWGLQRSFTFLSTPDAKAPASSTDAAAVGPRGMQSSMQGSMQGSRAVPLIKDWAGVLSEVGDHQSLVASLKASPYYDMLKVSDTDTTDQRHRGNTMQLAGLSVMLMLPACRLYSAFCFLFDDVFLPRLACVHYDRRP